MYDDSDIDSGPWNGPAGDRYDVAIDHTFDERESDIYDEAEGPKRWVRRPITQVEMGITVPYDWEAEVDYEVDLAEATA